MAEVSRLAGQRSGRSARIGRKFARTTMQALSISIATLALAAGLATPLSAQTAAGPDAPKKALTPMKVQSPHPSPKRIAAAGQAGKQAAAGKHLTAGYQENDINAA